MADHFFDTSGLRTGALALRLRHTTAPAPENEQVPSYHFNICLAGSDIVAGTCTLWVGNTMANFFRGNIGYSVHQAHRGHGYAAAAARLMFTLARRHGMPYLHIGCAPENLASRKTCERAGARLLCIADLPTDTLLYRQGARKTCVYRVDLAGGPPEP